MVAVQISIDSAMVVASFAMAFSPRLHPSSTVPTAGHATATDHSKTVNRALVFDDSTLANSTVHLDSLSGCCIAAILLVLWHEVSHPSKNEAVKRCSCQDVFLATGGRLEYWSQTFGTCMPSTLLRATAGARRLGGVSLLVSCVAFVLVRSGAAA